MSVFPRFNLNSSEGCSETSFEKQTYVFSWTIKKDPQFPDFNASREFQPAKKLRFHATVDNDSIHIDHVNCEIKISLRSGDEIKIRYDLSITDLTGKELYKTRGKHNYTYGPLAIYRITFSSSSEALIFKCKMEFFYPSTDVESSNLQQSKSPSLRGDLKAMYDNSLHADLLIQVDGSIVRAHKSLLSARSPVFAQMFESPMEELEKNSIKIVDLKLPVLKGFLEFLYTEFLSVEDFEYVCDMYYAADKYFVHSLRKKCADILLSMIDVVNAFKVLSLADRHSDDMLKDSVMDFFRDHFDDILETDYWEEFLDEETALAAEVMRSCSRKRKKVNDEE